MGILRDMSVLLSNLLQKKVWRNEIKDILIIIKKIAEMIKGDNKFTGVNQKLSFLNNDLDHDIYVQKGKIYFIDWHLAGYGDKAWDIARFVCAYKDYKSTFLKEYMDTLEKAEDILARVKLYEIINRLLIISGAINTMEYNVDFMMNYKEERNKILELIHGRISKEIKELKSKL